jgi:MoxR-like ATPase
VAVPVLRHRIATNFQAQAEGLTSESIIERLVKETPEPEIPKFVK